MDREHLWLSCYAVKGKFFPVLAMDAYRGVEV